jgi:CheY-like chemotaxis protein
MAKTRILVAEDEAIVAKDIQQSLESLGYSVPALTTTGEETIQKAQEIKPDLIMMDILLKGHLNGIEAAEKIKNLSNTPIIFLTAYADDKTIHQAKLTKPSAYLVKPFEEKDLKASIETALHRHKHHSTDKQKISDLKQEVNTLLEEQGKPKKYSNY